LRAAGLDRALLRIVASQRVLREGEEGIGGAEGEGVCEGGEVSGEAQGEGRKVEERKVEER
jgi:hypothetical protein